MRRTLLTALLAVVVLAGLGALRVTTGGGSAITQGRLERSVTASFSNAYTQEAALLDHPGVDPATLRARTMCDKGPGVAQSGPGTSWICLVAWHDPAVPMPSTGYGKLELTVHSNGCYTASAPSSLVGYQTITDAAGRTVPNPVYEYDACLDPSSPGTPTGVTFPSALTITTTAATRDASGHVSVGLACATGAAGCVGTVEATVGAGRHAVSLGSMPFRLTEESTTALIFPTALPTGATEVTFTVHASTGVAPSPATVPVGG